MRHVPPCHCVYDADDHPMGLILNERSKLMTFCVLIACYLGFKLTIPGSGVLSNTNLHSSFLGLEISSKVLIS